MKPGGNDPGPDGDGKWRFDGPIPGDGARRGGVARPKPESVSMHNFKKKNNFVFSSELERYDAVFFW